jgi:hypothetical protein
VPGASLESVGARRVLYRITDSDIDVEIHESVIIQLIMHLLLRSWIFTTLLLPRLVCAQSTPLNVVVKSKRLRRHRVTTRHVVIMPGLPVSRARS